MREYFVLTTARSIAVSVLFLLAGCEKPRASTLDAVPAASQPATRDNPLLIRAIVENNTGLALTLIRRGTDPNLVDPIHRGSALYYAAGSPHCMIDVVRALIEHGARINVQRIDGSEPLHAACESGFCPEVVEYLISKGAAVGARENSHDTPLHMAAYNPDFREHADQIVEILIAHGADVNAIDADGRTPLDFAAEVGAPTRIATLIEHGAKRGKELAASTRK